MTLIVEKDQDFFFFFWKKSCEDPQLLQSYSDLFTKIAETNLGTINSKFKTDKLVIRVLLKSKRSWQLDRQKNCHNWSDFWHLWP